MTTATTTTMNVFIGKEKASRQVPRELYLQCALLREFVETMTEMGDVDSPLTVEGVEPKIFDDIMAIVQRECDGQKTVTQERQYSKMLMDNRERTDVPEIFKKEARLVGEVHPWSVYDVDKFFADPTHTNLYTTALVNAMGLLQCDQGIYKKFLKGIRRCIGKMTPAKARRYLGMEAVPRANDVKALKDLFGIDTEGEDIFTKTDATHDPRIIDVEFDENGKYTVSDASVARVVVPMDSS